MDVATIRLRKTLALLALTVATACSSELPPIDLSSGSYAFGVFGDGPYRPGQMDRFEQLLGDVNSGDLAFFIHVGDILWYPCSDETYRARRRQLSTIEVPVVYTPGDNEWTDCHERRPGGFDPLERLRTLRQIFFADLSWSGVSRLGPITQAQDSAWSTYVENVRWDYGGITFATVHVVGSDNGLERYDGFTRANRLEAEHRGEAAREWVKQTFEHATERGARAVVLAMHADLDFEGRWGPIAPYDSLKSVLADHTIRWEKPVLLIHGDNHELTVDHPLKDPTGEALANLTRLETFGSPDIGWVRVVVDTLGTELFSFEPRRMPGWYLH